MKPRYLPKFIFSESRLLVQKELHMLEGDCSQQEDTHLCVCVFVKKKKPTMYKMAETTSAAVVVNVPG